MDQYLCLKATEHSRVNRSNQNEASVMPQSSLSIKAHYQSISNLN